MMSEVLNEYIDAGLISTSSNAEKTIIYVDTKALELEPQTNRQVKIISP